MPVLQKCPQCGPETRPTLLTGGLCKYHFDNPGESVSMESLQAINCDVKIPELVKKVSEKQSGINRQYTKMRKEFLELNPYCIPQLDGCGKYASEIHHKSGRGINTLNVKTWLPTCRNCHEIITIRSAEAIDLGLSDRRNSGRDK